MKRTMLSIVSILALAPISSFASGFKVDMSVMDVVEQFNPLSIRSMAVGEHGLLPMYGLYMCKDNDLLKVSALSELDSEPSKYAYYFNVTRKPEDKVTLALSKKGKKPDLEAFKQAVYKAVDSIDCSGFEEKGIPLFSVESYLGSDSMTGLVKDVEMTMAEPVNKNTSGSTANKINSSDDKWLVTESNSPIDDSPSVTMFKKAEYGKQTLVLRCKENKTEAYISTDDYLGDKSKSVTVRYDKMKAQEMLFSLSTNNKALFVERSIPFIKSIMNVDSMVIRYSTYGGSTKTVTFNIDGLNEKLEPLRSACHW